MNALNAAKTMIGKVLPLPKPRPALGFRKLTKTAQLPKYASEGAAGLDLFADEDMVIPFLKRELVKTNIAVNLPEGIEAQVRARSGLALKKGIMVLNGPGTIDPDYTGGIGVILFNTDMEDFVVRRGDRIAQLVIASFVRVAPVIVDAEPERVTARGTAGFGSTGTAGLVAAALVPAVAPAAQALSFETPVVIQGGAIPDGAAVAMRPAVSIGNLEVDDIKIVAAPPQWFEGDPALMGDFHRPFVYRQNGAREFLDGSGPANGPLPRS